MQAARLFSPGDIRTVKVAIPVPAPGEVLVRVLAAGICGTDRHLFNGTFPSTPPVTLGHEFCGIIEAAGAGVALPPGTLVTCDPNIACGTCPQCLRGRINLCQNLTAIGIGRDGGFAEYCAFPAHRALPLPAGLDPRHGAFCEPLACCLHAIDLAAPKPGERVTVIGGGVIGLLTLQLARLAGAETLLITRQQSKRSLATELGATHAAASPHDARQIWPEGADLVLECAGTPESVAACPALTRTGGRITILGVLDKGAKVQVEPFDLLFREIQLLFAFLNPFTQGRAAALIASGQIRLEPLISRTITLGDAPEAIANAPRPGEVKVLILAGT